MNEKNPVQDYESTIGIQTFVLILLGVTLGSLAAIIVLPTWVPNLETSLAGESPKVFWYLSRGSAFVALSLLWLSMALGLMISNKMARIWPGVPASYAIHEYVSLLGLVFSIFHGLIILGDHYIQFTLVQILIPFATNGYRPFMVGMGQLGFYIWLLLALSFYIRDRIGQKTWRVLHYVSFAIYCIAFYHGFTSGTDTNTPWAQIYYWFSASSLIFLLIYRIIIASSIRAVKQGIHPSATL